AGTTALWASLNTAAAALPALALDSATPVNVTPGAPQRLLIALPGEGFSQGSPTGKKGTPISQTAGTALSGGGYPETSAGVAVAAVDQYNNLALGDNDTVLLSSGVGAGFAAAIN